MSAPATSVLDDPHLAILATVDPDGRPQSSVEFSSNVTSDSVLISTVVGRRKTRNMVRDPRSPACWSPNAHGALRRDPQDRRDQPTDPTKQLLHDMYDRFMNSATPPPEPGAETCHRAGAAGEGLPVSAGGIVTSTAEFDRQTGPFRRELLAHCYRAARLRARRRRCGAGHLPARPGAAFDGFENRSSLRHLAVPHSHHRACLNALTHSSAGACCPPGSARRRPIRTRRRFRRSTSRGSSRSPAHASHSRPTIPNGPWCRRNRCGWR